MDSWLLLYILFQLSAMIPKRAHCILFNDAWEYAAQAHKLGPLFAEIYLFAHTGGFQYEKADVPLAEMYDMFRI